MYIAAWMSVESTIVRARLVRERRSRAMRRPLLPRGLVATKGRFVDAKRCE